MFQRISDRFSSEKAHRSADRLPPGQSLTTRFPVLHYGSVPTFDAKKWDFRIYGEVEREARWTWQEFNQLPHRILPEWIYSAKRAERPHQLRSV